MRNIWVTSDLHLNHYNIIKYCNRPFDCVSQMNDCIETLWNETVKDGDLVYNLGDVYLGNGEQANKILTRLKGRKRLILGNHDNAKDKVLQLRFQKIVAWRHFKDFGLLLTHVPVHNSCLNEKTPCNVHGHIHNNSSPPSLNHRNVCVEVTDYRPVNIEALRVT